MLTFQNPLSHEQQLGRRRIGTTFGSVEVDHEIYPAPVTDTRTGLTVGAGANVILHVAKRQLSTSRDQLRQAKHGLLTDLHLLAQNLQTWFHPDALPRHVFGATHIAMGRLACAIGFRRVLPDPRFISTDYREHFTKTLKAFNAMGINTEDDDNIYVAYMPTSDLISVYGGDQPPTSAEIAELRGRTREESHRIEAEASQTPDIGLAA